MRESIRHFFYSEPEKIFDFFWSRDCDECVNVRSADMFANRAKDLGFYIEYVRIHNSNHTFSPVNGALYPPLRDIMKKAAEFVKKFS